MWTAVRTSSEPARPRRTEQATRRQGWRLTTREQRRLARLLHYSPRLRSTVPAGMAESYPHARRKTLEATEEPSTTFPETCPWTLEQGLDAEFWPEGERPPVRRMGFNA